MISTKIGGNKPHIKWNHIDGPVMHLSDCRMHWLTWPERIALWLRLTTVERINRKRTMQEAR